MTTKTQQKNYFQRWEGAQRRIGITGGIASGKSQISDFLKNKTYPFLDDKTLTKEIKKKMKVEVNIKY